MMDPSEARAILLTCRLKIGDDFHRLSTGEVELLLHAAKLYKYRKPKNANGSRARYFHDFLQRRARKVER